MGRIIDISQTLRPGMPVWPGDTPYEAFWAATLADTGSVNVGGVTMSLHSGTHADAPKHFRDGGLSPDSVDLDAYVGPAVVADLTRHGAAELCRGITAEMLVAALPDRFPDRLLCKTGTAPEGTFPEAFAHFTTQAAELLAEGGVRLVGIDTPSVDHVEAKDLGAHNVFCDHGTAILENLELGKVLPGEYELIALPLKIAGMDASPVRAVLIAL